MGSRQPIPVGAVFTRLTVLCDAAPHVRPNGKPYARSKCQCECGSIIAVANASLRAKRPTKSCGCLQREKLKERAIHNNATAKKQTVEYATWKGIKARTTNPNLKNFDRYGGRGITMCDRWKNSFVAFLEDMGPRPSSNHSIDRFPDNDGNYEPGNCRWATKLEQQQNTSKNKYLVVDDVTKPVGEWSIDTGISRSTIHLRLNRGWSDRDAVMTPLQRRNRAK